MYAPSATSVSQRVLAERIASRRAWFVVISLLIAVPGVAAERVRTLSPHLAELVCAAGACDRLAGVVAYSDYPPQVAKLPHVGDAFNLNLEQLAALQPDLVISWDGGSSAQ